MIEIKSNHHFTNCSSMTEINPQKIILLVAYRDQWYDIKSEDMGWFCDILLDTEDGPTWEHYNPEESYSFIENLLTSAGDSLVEISNTVYRNKKNDKDFMIVCDKKTKQPMLVFKDEYIVSKYGDLDFWTLVCVCRFRYQSFELKLWEEAMDSFPDENLRKYFRKYSHFMDFYNKMNSEFPNEETRFYGVMFDICPELKSIATDASDVTERKVETWSIKAHWN